MIATGGGAVLDPENVEALRRGARVVLLEGPPEVLASRCARGDRPALTPLPPLDEVRAVLAARQDAYRAPRPTTASGPAAGRRRRSRA